MSFSTTCTSTTPPPWPGQTSPPPRPAHRLPHERIKVLRRLEAGSTSTGAKAKSVRAECGSSMSGSNRLGYKRKKGRLWDGMALICDAIFERRQQLLAIKPYINYDASVMQVYNRSWPGDKLARILLSKGEPAPSPCAACGLNLLGRSKFALIG